MSSKTAANKVRVAIIGVGNCADSLVQGVHYYRDADEHEEVPGLMHVNLGGYHIRDIEFSAAFDAVTSQLPYELDAKDVHVGPSDYVPWLEDRKWCHIKIEGRSFGDVPLEIDLKLEVWNSPNSAGVIIDAVRCAKLALDRGIGGAITAPSSYFMKSPPIQYTDDMARELTERFIRQETMAVERG